MEFKQFTNEDSGICGIVPEGWIEKRPGEFGRSDLDIDAMLLVQLGIPGGNLALMTELLSIWCCYFQAWDCWFSEYEIQGKPIL